MSRRYHVILEIEMPDDTTAEDAASWGASVLETSFTKPNPKHGPGEPRRVPMPANEHPYRPKVLKAEEVAQPAPRRPY
jgi:hypothetical protein